MNDKRICATVGVSGIARLADLSRQTGDSQAQVLRNLIRLSHDPVALGMLYPPMSGRLSTGQER